MPISVSVSSPTNVLVSTRTAGQVIATTLTAQGITAALTPTVSAGIDINREGLMAHINDLQDVDVSALPQPYPSDLDFNQDQRFVLTYDPSTGQWIAAPEPVVTLIDGGDY
jgi:hypothetical protein